MIASRTAFTAALVALLLVAAQTAPVPKDNKGNGNGKADAPGLNKLTSSNAGGLLRGEARAEWEKARDKKPDAELARIRRAENRFRGMADADVTALALDYGDGQTTLSIAELNEARSRLRQIGDGAELEVLNDTAKARRDDSPWISQDEELSKLADYSDTLSGFKADEILVESEEYGQDRFNLDNLLDLNGELAGPDTPDV